MQHYSTHLWHIVASPMFRAFCGYEVHRPMGLLLTACQPACAKKSASKRCIGRVSVAQADIPGSRLTPKFYLLIWNAVVMGKDKKAQPWAGVLFVSNRDTGGNSCTVMASSSLPNRWLCFPAQRKARGEEPSKGSLSSRVSSGKLQKAA